MPKETAALGELLVVESLSRIDTKLDKLDDRLDGMCTTLVKQQGSLDEHVKRTNLLETKIETDTKTIREGLAREAADAVRAERNKILVTGLKVAGVVVGTGGAGLGIKELITAILKFWAP